MCAENNDLVEHVYGKDTTLKHDNVIAVETNRGDIVRDVRVHVYKCT